MNLLPILDWFLIKLTEYSNIKFFNEIKLLPRFHNCNSPNLKTKQMLIKRVGIYKLPTEFMQSCTFSLLKLWVINPLKMIAELNSKAMYIAAVLSYLSKISITIWYCAIDYLHRAFLLWRYNVRNWNFRRLGFPITYWKKKRRFKFSFDNFIGSLLILQ